MSIIAFIVLGGAIGLVATRALKRERDTVGNVLIGIIGGAAGGVISELLASGNTHFFVGELYHLEWSFVAAILSVAALNTVSRIRDI